MRIASIILALICLGCTHVAMLPPSKLLKIEMKPFVPPPPYEPRKWIGPLNDCGSIASPEFWDCQTDAE